MLFFINTVPFCFIKENDEDNSLMLPLPMHDYATSPEIETPRILENLENLNSNHIQYITSYCSIQ